MKEQLKKLKKETYIKLFISYLLIGLLLGVFHGSSILIGILCFVLIFADIIYTGYIAREEGFETCRIMMSAINLLCSYLSRPIEVTDTNDENVKIFIYKWWGPDELELDILNNNEIHFIYNDELYSTIKTDEFILADENKIRILVKKIECKIITK